MSVRRPLFWKACALGVALMLALPARAQIAISFNPTVSPAWDSAVNWLPTGLPGAGNLATIATSIVGVNNAQSVGGINLTSGGIGGNGTLTLTSTTFSSTWSGGSLTQGGTLKIGTGHTLAITGAADKTFAHGSVGFGGHIIQNQGTITWANGGNLLGGDGSAFLNDSGGVFRALNNQTLGYNGSGNTPTFSNAGLFEKSAGTGITTVSSFTFTNTGTVAALTGKIQFAPSTNLSSTAGTFTANGGGINEFLGTQAFTDTNFLGTGLNQISGGTSTFSGLITANNLVFSGGTALGSAAIDGSSVKWTGGSWLGSGIFDFLGANTLTIEGAATKTLAHGSVGFNGRTIGISGQAIWKDAGQIAMGDGAGFIVNPGATFTIQNDSTIGYNNSGNLPFFTNGGTLIKQTATGTTFFDRVEFTNTGTIDLQKGIINVSGSGATFNNSGAVIISTGARLELGGTGGTSTGLFDLAFGGNVRLLGGTQTFNTGASVTGLGSFDILGGTLLVNGSATVGNIGFSPGEVQLLAGTMGGSGTLTVKSAAKFTWQGGTMNGSGTLAIENGGSLDLISGTQKFLTNGSVGFSGHILSNAGTVRWSGTGAVLGGDGAQIINQLSGLFEVQSASSFGYSGSGDAPTFTNHGLFRKTANGGTFTVTGGTFTNSATGIVEVQTGTLSLAGGGSSTGTLSTLNGAMLLFSAPYTIGGGKIIGSGDAQVSSNVTFSGNTDIGHLATSGRLKLVAGGTLNGNAVVSVTGGGGGSTLEWNGGNMLGSGVTQILPGGTLLVTGAASRTFAQGSVGFNGRTIDNFGTILWLGAGTILGGDGAALNNQASAIFDAQVDSTLGYNGSGNAMTFTNAGTFKKSAGFGVLTYNGGAFNNTGLALVQSGTLRFGSGGTSTGGEFSAVGGTTIEFTSPYTFQSGAKISGSGVTNLVATSLTVAGGAPSLVTGILQLPTGSNITGSGILEVGGELRWTGGNMLSDGITRILAPGKLLLSGIDAKTLSHGSVGFNGRRIQNAGLVSLTGVGSLLLGDQASIENQVGATFALESGAGIGYNGSGIEGSLSNSGLFIKRNNTSTATLASFSFTNQGSGVVTNESGILQVATAFTNLGGTINAFGGASIFFTGAKTFNGGSFLGSGDIDVLGGNTTLGGSITSQNLNLAGGSIFGAASLFGQVEWSGGALLASANLVVGDSASVLQISGATDKTIMHGSVGFNGSILDNQGSVFWTGTGRIMMGDQAQIINRLNFIAQNDSTIGYNGSGNVPLFTNQGSFTKITSNGTTRVEIPFTNSGTLLVTSGTLRFTSSFTHTGGFITLSNNAIVRFDQGLNFPSGILAGVGLVDNNVTNGGTISPGAPIGTLVIDGTLTLLGTSNLLLELGGTVQGVSYDLLDVDGSVVLGGTLALTFTNGFQSSVTPANTFAVLTGTGALTGAFSNIANGQRLFTLDGSGSFQVNYGVGSAFASNTLILSAFAPIPEPSTWALLIAGAAAVFFMARRRRA